MRYVLLIYENEQAAAALPEAEQAAVLGRWFEYTEALQASGTMVTGEALQPTPTATTVRAEAGRSLIVDGPFAETKEHLGGFYLIDAADLDEAIAWAAKMPHLDHGGSVEIRPVMEFETV